MPAPAAPPSRCQRASSAHSARSCAAGRWGPLRPPPNSAAAACWVRSRAVRCAGAGPDRTVYSRPHPRLPPDLPRPAPCRRRDVHRPGSWWRWPRSWTRTTQPEDRQRGHQRRNEPCAAAHRPSSPHPSPRPRSPLPPPPSRPMAAASSRSSSSCPSCLAIMWVGARVVVSGEWWNAE